MKAVRNALFVFFYMALLAVQTSTGFLYNLVDGVRPKAVVVIDDVIDFALVSWLGREMAAVTLVLLGLALGYIAYRRAATEQRAQAGQDSAGGQAAQPTKG